MAVNCVVISGNIVRDAQLNHTNSDNTPVLNFCVAVNDRRHNKQTDTWDDHANFIDCTMFGKRAEALHSMLLKGVKVSVQGKLRQNTWTDKDTGKNRSSISVLVDNLEFMSPKNSNSQTGSADALTPETAQVPEVDDEDVPF